MSTPNKKERRVDILGQDPPETSIWEKLPPVLLIFGALGSMIYGFRASLRQDIYASNRGQMGRVYFQFAAIVALVGLGLNHGGWQEIRQDFNNRYPTFKDFVDTMVGKVRRKQEEQD